MIEIEAPDGSVVEFPDGMADVDIAAVMRANYGGPSADDGGLDGTAKPVAPATMAGTNIPMPTGANMRALQIGAQGAGRGLAELAALPLDLAAGGQNILASGVNKLFGTKIPMATPASELVRDAASAVVPTVDEASMSSPEKYSYNINRFGAQAAGAVPALVTAAGARAASIAAGSGPRAADSLLRPYMGEGVGRTVAGDMAAAAGSGTAVTAADEAGYTGPVSQAIAALGGGLGGMTALSMGETALRRGASAAGRAVGANIDAAIPVDPQNMMPVTTAISDAAAGRVQGAAAYDPAESAARIRGNTETLRALDPNAPMPSPAALAEDPGLATLEGVVNRQNPGPAMARQREFATGVRDTIDRTAPEGADPSALMARVQAEADGRIQYGRAAEDNVQFDANAAQRAADAEIAGLQGRVGQLEGREQRVQDIRVERGTQLRDAGGREAPASQRLDEAIVDRGYIPARTEKNRQFDSAPGRTQELPADDVVAAARDVRGRTNDLRPDEQLPSEFVRRLRALEPRYERNEFGTIENMGGPGTALGGDLADTRKYLSTSIERAETAGNFDLASSLKTLKSQINRTIEDAPGYADANANYRQFADTYRPGRGDAAAQFTRQIDRDPTRTSTPPSQTASKFLQPGQPEKAAALQRMITASENPLAGQSAAREYLLANMVESGVVDRRTGVIRPDKIRQWQESWGDLSGVVPGFQNALNAMRQEAAQGVRVAQRAAGMTERAGETLTAAQKNAKTEGQRFADELRTAQRNTKATEDQINKGALGLVLNSDPDKAVASIMAQPNRTGKLLDELITTVGSDEQARNGLKAAVRDYLIDKATTGASEKLRPGDSRGPVSQAKLSGIFKEHEAELAKVFSPEEMNTLRAGHKALELANVERLRTGSGSDTVEKGAAIVDQILGTGIGKGVEAALRVKYGMLKAGGLVSTTRRLFAGVTGGPDPAEVSRLIERAAVDPELMGLLLGRKLPVGSPAWNKKLNQVLALGEGARETDQQ